MTCSRSGIAKVLLPLLLCAGAPWRAAAADPPPQGPQSPSATAPPDARTPSTPPARPAAPTPAPEDDLFEFLGTVDLDGTALVDYLARTGPPSGAHTPATAPKKTDSGMDKSP